MSNVDSVRVDGVAYGIQDGGAVRFDAAQSLTNTEKTRARSNIGAVSDSELTNVVRYTAQSKTTAQKAQARTNIGAQETLTFDNSPTSGSNNPVKSGGVYTALQGKQNTLTFDNTPTANSNNPVKSGGIKTAIDGALASVATADAGKGVMLRQKNTIAASVPEFTIYGKATQTRTEKSPNLAKPTETASDTVNGVTYTYDAATNTVTANGTSTGITQSDTHFLRFNLPAGTYTFKCMTFNDMDVMLGISTGGQGSSSKFRGSTTRTFTETAECNLRMYAGSGVTFTNKRAQFMVVSGSTAPTEFVPYREASPSPTNPSPINMPGSSGSIGVMHAGKNLANLSSFYTSGTSTISGIDAATGAITVTGKGTNRYAGAFGPGLLYFVPGVTYTFSGRVLANDGGYAQAAVRNGAGQIRYSSTANQLGPFSLTFTPDSAGWYVTLFCSWDDASLTGGVTYGGIQIEVASSATAFEPYGGATVTLPTPNGLPGLPVSSGGNYIDKDGQRWVCDTIDKAAGTYTRRIGSVTWDGSNDEQWTYQGWSLPGFSIGVPGSVVQTNVNLAPNVLCNRLVAIPNNSTFGNYDSLLSMSNNASTYQVAIRGLNTEQKFRDFLGDHHEITMIYQLATPVVTQLSAAQIAALDALQSHYGTTILATTDAMQPEMAAAMCSDLAARIAALEDCIDAICYAHNDLVDGSGYHIDYIDGHVVYEA